MKQNFKDIQRRSNRVFQKLQGLPKKQKLIVGLSSVFVLVLAIGGFAWSNHASDVRARELVERKEEEIRLAESKQAALEKKQAEEKQRQGQQSKDSTPSQASETKKEEKKYATSSDPRSTAYSNTPPPPAPNSFNTRITHAGQLGYGAMLYYNATKGEKGYYGGDLVLSPSNVTISRSGSDSAALTVSSRSGKAMSMPSMPWDEQNPHFFIASTGGGGSSYNMIVDTYNMPGPGVYQLHIRASCYDFGSDGCEAHGFITVYVVD